MSLAGSEQYDAIVVGSGAAGSWAAKELTEGGFHVLLLEAGPPINPARDFPVPAPPDRRFWSRARGMLIGQHVQMRSYGYKARTCRFFVNDRQNPYKTPRGQPFNWFRGRQVGGRLHVWGRYALRMSANDFKAASSDGHGVDWPLSYSDLEPYYDKVESFFGLYGNRDGIKGLPDGIYTGPYPLNQYEERFKAAVEKAFPDRRVISTRLLKHSPERVPLPITVAQQTGRLTLQANSVVERITIDPATGKATGVSVIDAVGGPRTDIRGRVVVLCASTIETLRILLNSSSSRYPNGLGNSSGLLGHYLMDHMMVLLTGPFESDETTTGGDTTEFDPYDFGQTHGFYIPRFQNVGGHAAGFLRGYAVQGAISRLKPTWHMMSQGEILPRFENDVSVDTNRRDRLGVPIPIISLKFGKNERAMAKDALQSMRDMAAVASLSSDALPHGGFIERAVFAVWKRRLFSPTGAFVPGTAAHEVGGARMGNNSKDSVLNRFNQCWDAENVFVTDGACFASIGTQNVTLTIMALTSRACEYIINEFGQ